MRRSLAVTTTYHEPTPLNRRLQRGFAEKLTALAYGVSVHGKALTELERDRTTNELAELLAAGLMTTDFGDKLYVRPAVRAVMTAGGAPPAAKQEVTPLKGGKRGWLENLTQWEPEVIDPPTACCFVNAFGVACAIANRYRVVDSVTRRHMDCCPGHALTVVSMWREKYSDDEAKHVRLVKLVADHALEPVPVDVPVPVTPKAKDDDKAMAEFFPAYLNQRADRRRARRVAETGHQKGAKVRGRKGR